jgi:hypothetical protein
MTNKKDLERFVRDASIRTDATANERILKMMHGAFERSTQPQVVGRLARWSVAAAILIGLSILIGHVGPFGSSGVAWGKVADRVAAMDTFLFSLAINVSDANGVEPAEPPTSKWVFYVSEQYGFRMDISGDGQTVSWYVPPQGDTLTMVVPAEKKWTRSPIPPEQRGKMPQEYEDPEEYIRRFMARPQTKLGRSVIDGVAVEGIEVTDPPTNGQPLENAVGRLWVDTTTELPIRIEIEGKAGDKAVRWQMDFRWADAVDPSVFEPNIPADYTSISQ